MKGQTAVEMIIYISFVMLMLAVAMISIADREDVLYESRIGISSKTVAESVASEINIALSVGDGYSNSFSLPTTLLGGINYTIDLDKESQRVYIEWRNRTLFFPILTSEVTGNPKKGNNTIRNENGAIIFE